MRQLAQIMKSKLLVGGLVGLVAAAVVVSLVGYSALSSDVRLTVDGEEREVTAMGDTVGDVLESEGIDVGEHDVVAPSVDEEISDGSRITVRTARPLELTVDGEAQTHWVTAQSLNSALSELGRSFDRAAIDTSRSAPIPEDGLSVEVVTPKKVTVVAGGKKPVTRAFKQMTVKDVLDQLDIKVDKNDKVKPGLKHEIAKGDKIVYTDIQVKRETIKGEEIDFETVEKADDSLLEGRSEVDEEGRVGLRNATYKVRVVNGEVVERTELSAEVVREAIDRVVRIGTKEPEPEPAPEPESSAPAVAGGSVWDRLAQCESGGNWSINTGNGYYGGLQFTASTWRSVGGSGLPHQHSREEQIKRGQILQSRAGWGQWPSCASKLGLY